MQLLYVMDPMCSWCWAFREPLSDFLSNHSDLDLELMMGGLAPDSDLPMPNEQQQMIQGIWHQIESKTGANFNHDFWKNNTPKRSTYPACRAVIAAKQIGGSVAELAMAEAIQQAYYQRAMNPSEINVLSTLAAEIGLDADQFQQLMLSQSLESNFQQHLEQSRRMGINGFPALLLRTADAWHPLTLGYTDLSRLEQRFAQIVS